MVREQQVDACQKSVELLTEADERLTATRHTLDDGCQESFNVAVCRVVCISVYLVKPGPYRYMCDMFGQ